jgi:hypothetical protein
VRFHKSVFHKGKRQRSRRAFVCTEAFSAGENADAFAAVRFRSSVCHGRKRKRFRRSAFDAVRFHPSVCHGRKRQRFRRACVSKRAFSKRENANDLAVRAFAFHQLASRKSFFFSKISHS